MEREKEKIQNKIQKDRQMRGLGSEQEARRGNNQRKRERERSDHENEKKGEEECRMIQNKCERIPVTSHTTHIVNHSICWEEICHKMD